MAKALMIQGTMSNAGKSLIAAGLCRIFKQDGYRVAPFKSQNMALNSYITEDGLEMGRAQVVQAEAAGIKPDVAMNPILLKPTTDVGSQVIVNGVPIGNMKAKDYFAYKKELIPEIRKAYEKLDQEYDIIVIEGAGSPAEINLKQDDIVNMGLARMVQAPVLLAGDIDRGGVFAQLYGTVSLLEPEEKALIKGLIINKFRGDSSILEPGVRQLEELCHLPVVGVVPYMNVEIDDEDSLSSRLENRQPMPEYENPVSGVPGIHIAVIRFPKISNFTDFAVFSCIPGVTLRYVSRTSELGTPDLVILPGTKNTISDLLWMRQNGLEALILKLADRQVPIWGICGGYQMLGEKLEDLLGLEGEPGRSIAGMGLLPMKTAFEQEKARAQVEGAFSQVEGLFEGLSGRAFSGYEIHMGRTVIDRELGPADTARFFHGKLEICRPLSYLMEVQSGSKRMKEEGWSRGNVYGSYVHGIFDGEGIAEQIVNALRQKKGLSRLEQPEFDYWAYKEQQYDLLAAELRNSLDMKAIYGILEAGVCGAMKMEHNIHLEQVLPEKIEERSFSIIGQELEQMGIRLRPDEEMIIKRAIHTTADFEYASSLVFSPNAPKLGIQALREGAVIVTDTNMAWSGINKRKLESLGGRAVCFMADEDVAKTAKERGCTRAAVSMEKAARLFGSLEMEAGEAADKEQKEAKEPGRKQPPVIVAVGNAPTALVRLYELMEEDVFHPALIIGVPVGFVNVVQSKEWIISRKDVPYIVARGRKGGSNVAAAIVNALLYQVSPGR